MKKFIISLLIGLACLSAYAQFPLWECVSCKQQYQGSNPPYYTKCPSTNNKFNHLWNRKK